MFSLNFFKPLAKSIDTLDLKPVMQSRSQEIEDLRLSFTAPFFAKLSQSGLNHYFQEPIQALELSQDYITAYFAVKANPQAACLFSKEIQDKIAERKGLFKDLDILDVSDEETVASDPANTSPANNSPAHSPKSEGQVSELSLEQDEPCLAIVPFQKKLSDTLHEQAEAAFEARLKTCLKTHLASVSFHAAACKKLALAMTESQAVATAPIVKISQTENKEIKLNTAATKFDLKETLQNILALADAAKSAFVTSSILSSFAPKAHSTILALLYSNNPVTKTLALNAKNASTAQESKMWIETLKAHIQIQPQFKQFLKAHKIEVAFLSSFTDEEQPHARRALLDSSTKHFIQSEVIKGSPDAQILAKLKQVLEARIEKQTFVTFIQNTFKGEQLEKAITLINKPTAKIKSLLDLTIGGEKQGRETMRMLAFTEICNTLNPKPTKQAWSLEDRIKTALKVANKYKNLEALNLYLNTEELKLIPEKHLADLTREVVNQRALVALGKADKFALLDFSKEQLALLRDDLKTALTVLGFDLEGNDSL